MIHIYEVTKFVSQTIFVARYIPNDNEEWFLNRDEHGEVRYGRKATPESRSGATRSEALTHLLSWLNAAQRNKRYIVEVVNKKGKTINIETCGCDEEDVKEFFERKNSITNILCVRLKGS